MNFVLRLNGRLSNLTADDELHAARRAVMALLLDEEDAGRGEAAYGRDYPVRVVATDEVLRSEADSATLLMERGRDVIVDVAAQPGRGAVTARWLSDRD